MEVDGSEPITHKRRRLDWVMPGDDILHLEPGAALTIGRGARQDNTRIVAVRSGQYEQHDSKHFVIADEKSYIPRNEDLVIATVTRVAGFAGYQLDAGCGTYIKLDALAFDGASKRSRPELRVGATVYCRVVQSRCEIELEASCCAVTGPRKDWMSGESLFGELKGGYVHTVRPLFARYLLSSPLLDSLGARIPFECCIGVNGRVWVRAGSVKNTARIARCLTFLQRAIYPEGEKAYLSVDEILDDFFPVAKAAAPTEGDNGGEQFEL